MTFSTASSCVNSNRRRWGGRYVFVLGFDGFNPHNNKLAGKKHSLGDYPRLNLPQEDRYKPENMFLAGIIPAPHEPPKGGLNHYVTPIVDEFLEFWALIALHEQGCLVRAALAAVVSDLPGKSLGFGPGSQGGPSAGLSSPWLYDGPLYPWPSSNATSDTASNAWANQAAGCDALQHDAEHYSALHSPHRKKYVPAKNCFLISPKTTT